MTKFRVRFVAALAASCIVLPAGGCELLTQQRCGSAGVVNEYGRVHVRLADPSWENQGVIYEAAIVEDGFVTVRWINVPLSRTGNLVVSLDTPSWADFVFVRFGRFGEVVDFGFTPMNEGRWCTADNVGAYVLSLEPFTLEKEGGTIIDTIVPFERLQEFPDHPDIIVVDLSD